MRKILKALFRPRSATPILQPPGGRRRLLKRIVLGAFLFLAAFAVLGFFIVPPVAKHYLVKGLSTALDRQVSIEAIKLNPFSMVAVVTGLSIREPGADEVFASFAELRVDLQAQSLIQRGPILREVSVTSPYVHIVRNADARTYNFSDLIAKFSTPESPPADDSGERARFSLNNVQVFNGRIAIDDRPKAARHAISEINIAIPSISSLPYLANSYVEPAFAARVNDTPISLQGRTKPFQDTLETSVDIEIDRLNIPRYMEYVPADLGFRIPSGSLDARLTVVFVRAFDRPPVFWIKGDLALEDFGMTERDGTPLMKFSRLEVPGIAINVSGRQLTFGTIALQRPEVFVRRNRDGSLNWMALASSDQTGKPDPEPPPGESFKLKAPEIMLSDGTVHVADLVPQTAFQTTLSGIQAALRGFALPQTEPANAELSFGTAFGEAVHYTGSAMLSPPASEGSLQVRKVRLTNYAPYYEHLLLYRLEDGIADLSTRYAYSSRGNDHDLTLSGLNLTLSSARIRKTGAQDDFLMVKSAQIRDGAFDLRKQSVNIGEFVAQEGLLDVVREADGTINATRILATSTESASVEPGDARQENPWSITLNRAELKQWKASFTDLALDEPVKIVADALTLQAQDISNRENRRGRLELAARLNETGTLAVQGPLSLNPVAAEMKVELRDFGLVPLQPYFGNRINILVTSADLSVTGNSTLALQPEGPPGVTFDGEILLTRFASLDKAKSEDFLKWESLHVGGIAYNHEPMRLGIKEVALSDFYSRIIIFPDGRLNLQDIATREEETEPSPVDAAAPPEAAADNVARTDEPQTVADTGAPLPPIRIDSVTLQGGNVNFTDLFIKPNYSANLTAIGGSVTGLSSQLDSTADVDLRGRFAQTAPVEIKGTINPLVKNLFLDIEAGVRDIELGPFSPYSGKFVGYAIEKGKMAFNVAYRIEDRKLTAKNQLVLDQLTFGDKVESPQATKLPVLLAVALLKDRNGVIDINLPISGSLDDPQFSVGGLIVKVIVNLVTKAITSPFALIASLAGGGGEELSFIEFDPGLAALTPQAQEKLAALRKGLTDRPALRLDIMPRADPEQDREAQRRHMFEAQVKAQKLKDLVKQVQAVKSVDEVTIPAEEYEEYLRRAYKEAKFSKPRNAIGFVKTLPVEETEALMLTHIQVSDDDLLKLANQRGQAAKDFLTANGGVAPERVFLVAPVLEAQKPDARPKGGRVDFSLK